MAIGNAPWPIGVTMVGIHARTGREKIFSQSIAHVLNDETQRKYIQVTVGWGKVGGGGRWKGERWEGESGGQREGKGRLCESLIGRLWFIFCERGRREGRISPEVWTGRLTCDLFTVNELCILLTGSEEIDDVLSEKI